MSTRFKRFVDLSLCFHPIDLLAKQRVGRIRRTLTSDLDHLFSATLLSVTDAGDGKIPEFERAKAVAEMTECLRVYDSLSLWRAAEEIIRKNIVHPFVKKVRQRALPKQTKYLG